MFRPLHTAAVLLAAAASACLFDPRGAGPLDAGAGADADGSGAGDADADGGGAGDADADGDTDACAPATEICNGLDDDCDGVVDDVEGLERDRENCGACGNRCPGDVSNGYSECRAGTCALVCDEGFDDCDGDLETGCEVDLTTPLDCGACGNACGPTTPVCVERAGGWVCDSGCAGGLENCGGTCVDVDTNPRHCGECGAACPDRPNASRLCERGVCDFACDPGWGNCNPDDADGCERSLRTTDDCGACDEPCLFDHASASCATGTCAFVSCDRGFADCNDDLDDGCERPIDTLSDCGACGAACARDNASAECVGGTCGIAACDDGFGDCDHRDRNGCETDLLTSAEHCGGCDAPCAASEECLGGACVPSCPPGCDCDGSCDGSGCDCDAGCTCAFTCGGACTGSCTGTGTVCTIDAAARADLSSFTCSGGARCEIDLTSGHDATDDVTCSGEGTVCIFHCEDAHDCEIACTDGAMCLLTCNDATHHCQFDSCDGGDPSWCVDEEILSCNFPCP